MWCESYCNPSIFEQDGKRLDDVKDRCWDCVEKAVKRTVPDLPVAISAARDAHPRDWDPGFATHFPGDKVIKEAWWKASIPAWNVMANSCKTMLNILLKRAETERTERELYELYKRDNNLTDEQVDELVQVSLEPLLHRTCLFLPLVACAHGFACKLSIYVVYRVSRCSICPCFAKKNLCLSALCLFSETEGRKSEEREEAYAEAEVGEAEESDVG